MYYTKTCPMCGKDFETKYPFKKYCGAMCSGDAARSELRKTYAKERAERAAMTNDGRHCVVCGKPFTYNHKLKCDDCRDKLIPQTRFCHFCGTLFEARYFEQRYCGDYCAYLGGGRKLKKI